MGDMDRLEQKHAFVSSLNMFDSVRSMDSELGYESVSGLPVMCFLDSFNVYAAKLQLVR